MIRILANDGIEADGQAKLEAAGFEVVTEKVPQDRLAEALQGFDAICVRSATTVRKDLIDRVPKLKAIARGGVGMDNIDVDYARAKGIKVVNTPAASSRAVAELAFAHIFAVARSLHVANRELGTGDFAKLKKAYGGGIQLQGLTLGVVGLGRIGREAARIGLGLGMRVIGSDPFQKHVDVEVPIHGIATAPVVRVSSLALPELLKRADVITLHVPAQDGGPLLGEDELALLQEGAIVVNTARGGLIDEGALLAALEGDRIAGIALDVFEGEPTPDARLLAHPKVSVSPHIGAATAEAQRLIGIELADQLIAILS